MLGYVTTILVEYALQIHGIQVFVLPYHRVSHAQTTSTMATWAMVTGAGTLVRLLFLCSKAELAELSADASPLELGDWLAVCGPVLRDISAVSGRWWHLTLTEAQRYYDRWKTASPLERAQITPRLPDELMDVQYHRTEQREIVAILPDGTLLLKALEPAVIHISSLDAQAAFRLAQSRFIGSPIAMVFGD